MATAGQQTGNWRHRLVLAIAGAVVLAAMVGVRGPDQIASATAGTAGEWLLSGPSLWHPLAPQAAIAQAAYAAAGPRGWQNMHVIVAWLAIVCWLLPLPAKDWRGLTPLIPALLAVVLSLPAAGLSGFGWAVLVLSAWHARTVRGGSARTEVSFAAAAWLAAWLSPGALPLIAATAIENSSRWSRRQIAFAAVLGTALIHLTPHGTSIWRDAWVFFRWSPQASPGFVATIALLFGVAVLALALRRSFSKGQTGKALAPVLLLLAAWCGQSAYLWAAAVWMIPLWAPAKEQLRDIGVNVRWWMATSLLLATVAMAARESADNLNSWFNLAMERATVEPTLTLAARPPGGRVYINPGGLAMARFAGPLPARDASGETGRLGREPRLWRAQDRQARYDTVWLLGDTADYAPLARHLGESIDWRLAAVDATGLLFVRGRHGEEFPTEPAQQLARGMVGAANRTRFLADSALVCLAAQALPEAGELSRSAAHKSDLSSSTASARALVLGSLGQVRDALAESQRAVAMLPRSSEAWQTRTETLLRAGINDDAYAASQRAAELAPGDAAVLWLAARAAHAAHAFQAEAETLERLADLTEGRGGDAGFYLFYLGQSYAKQGLARPALRALKKAAQAPGLTGEQKREIEQEIAEIRSSAGTQ